MMMSYNGCILLYIFLLIASAGHSQDPLRFKDEVAHLTANDQSIKKEDIVLFTGSSTIRMWESLQADFPKYNIVNRGFGGSQTSDLLYFFNQLILPYNPTKIFIYEGDNDLSAGKSPERIMAAMDSLVTFIRQRVSASVPIYMISAKPSTSRWHLKDKYIEFNKRMSKFASSNKNLYFVDVWTPALDANGEVRKDIFLEDGLHMNRKGYEIWIGVIKKYLP
jgi:lysophospholipase L1-like esterase